VPVTLVGRKGPQPRDRLAQDAQDLHLADAEAFADGRPGEVFFEAQPHDLALARRERAHGASSMARCSARWNLRPSVR